MILNGTVSGFWLLLNIHPDVCTVVSTNRGHQDGRRQKVLGCPVPGRTLERSPLVRSSSLGIEEPGVRPLQGMGHERTPSGCGPRSEGVPSYLIGEQLLARDGSQGELRSGSWPNGTRTGRPETDGLVKLSNGQLELAALTANPTPLLIGIP